MAIANFTDLKARIEGWMDRSDISGDAEDFITLAEARLNRELKIVETDAMLTGVIGSRSIAVGTLKVVSPIVVKIVNQGREQDLIHQPDGAFNYVDDQGFPTFWAIDGQNIDFDCPLDQEYTFRFRYQGRFALSDAAPTNALLTDNPDVYLAACLVWGGLFTEDDRKISVWKALLDEFMSETKMLIAQAKKSKLTVDPALVIIGTNDFRGYER